MVSPTEAWAVAYTDILHSSDGGATWEKQTRPGWQNLYSVDFFDNQHGIAMGNTTLYTSDGGATWTENSAVFGYDVEMADANLAFITDHRVAGYFRTTNGGAAWNFHSMPSNIPTIQCFDSLNCVAASPSGVYHSYDGGLNWNFVPGQGGEFASTYFINHNQGWLLYGDSASRTTDGGATWTSQVLPGGSWIYDFFFTDANNGWGVGANIVRTTNGGATWQEVPTPQQSLPLWDVAFADAQHGIAGGDSFLNTDSVILTTADGGATWSTRTQGSINDVLSMVALDRDHAWGSHDYGGKVSRTTDGGRTWLVSEVGEQYLVLGGIDMADLQHGWTVGFETTYYEGRIYRTTDGGASWQMQFDPTANVLRSVAALDAQTAIIVGGDRYSGPIRHRTTDGGASWHELNVPITYFFYDVFFLDSETGWMVGGNGEDIVKTTDGGDTWFVQHTPAQYTLSSIHFSDPNNGWAGGYYGTLIRTTNGGATWTPQDPQIPEYTHVLDVSSTSPMRGWISGYGGGAQSRPFVKYTTDGGATWIENTPSVGPYDSFAALAFLEDEYGWAAGAGGIFRYSGDNLSTPTPIQATPTATGTTPPAPSRTPDPTSAATGTPDPTSVPGTPTAVPPSPTVGGIPSATTEPCTVQFSDVPPGSPFYSWIRCLACRGIVTGYGDGTFRPNSPVTRGQLAKLVSNAAGFTEAHSEWTFQDVPVDSTFHIYIERLYSRNVIGGYSCGGPGEQCVPPNNRPYFRPGANVTRGQTAKVVAEAALLSAPPPGRWTFQDVPEGSPFWPWVEALAETGAIGGYACGGAGEPCAPPENRPYYRPGDGVTRGQSSKIAAETFFPGCTTP
jgi:photosystem II stability/assembly factor-like uncharacterized protein